MAQVSGTKAVLMVSISTVIQALRQPGRAPLAAVSVRMPRPAVMAAARASGGSSTARTAVPIRPWASAPVAAGSRAYVALAQARTSLDSISGRETR